jgi:DNA topoisomerase-3
MALGITPKGEGYFSDNNTIITWAIGHLLVPCDPENYDTNLKKWSIESLPILPEQFQYKPNSRTKKQLNIVQKLLKKKEINKVIVATDAGREGELIARTILSHAKFKGESFRFWTSDALTKSVILNQMKNLKPLSNYNRLYYAGKARQVADWLIGMNLTRAVTVQYGDLFSVGRVQTAVLALLVKRKNEIENFKPEPYFNLEGEFDFSGKKLKAKWFLENKKERADWIIKEDLVKSLMEKCHNQPAFVKDYITERKTTPPPYLYSLTELQKHANRLYGFSATKTLNLAQELYEKYKCLSYPRTDSRYLGTKAFDLTSKLIDTFSDEYSKFFNAFDSKKLSKRNYRVFNDKGLTDHHALIPLKEFKGQASSDLGKIYFLVLKRFIAVFSKDHIYDESKIIINCASELFRTKGKVIVEQGFKELLGEEKDLTLPQLKKNEEGININLDSQKKETKPPSHYTEATLLHHMSNPSGHLEDKDLRSVFAGTIGLGTQATRANIIETILKRNYVAREARYLIATIKGEHLITLLNKQKFSGQLTKADETAKWEASLDEISKGSLHLGKGFVDSMREFTSNCISELKTTEKLSYTATEKKKFGNSSNASKSNASKSNTSNSEAKVISKCPSCEGNIVENAKAYGCENWRSGCKMTIWKKMSGKRISQSQVKKLLKSGKSDVLKGFKSKQGKVFDARLVLSEAGVGFEF